MHTRALWAYGSAATHDSTATRSFRRTTARARACIHRSHASYGPSAAHTRHATCAPPRVCVCARVCVCVQLTLMLAPFAPHLAEELWSMLGATDTLTYESWPTFDPELCVETTVKMGVQVRHAERPATAPSAHGANDAHCTEARRARARTERVVR
jgi:leucyl-tRNA synthetase